MSTTEITPPSSGAALAQDAAAPAPAADGFNFVTELDGDTKGFIQGKGFKSLGDMAKSYGELEKLIGQRDSIVQLPKSDKPEDWEPLYDRLGRPKSANDYKVELRDGVDPKFGEKAKEWFHKAGLSQRQAEPLNKAFNEYLGEMKAAHDSEVEAKLIAEGTALRDEWGQNYKSYEQAARTAAVALGISAESLDTLDKQIGFAQTMNLFRKLHEDYGIGKEDSILGGKTKNVGAAGTAEQARQDIERKKQDTDFMERWKSGDKTSVQIWEDLHRRAYPD